MNSVTSILSIYLLAGLLLPVSGVAGNAASITKNVRTIPMQNPAQPFELAAKLQWNPHDKRWDKVLVLYNGAKAPPAQHPVWAYLQRMEIPSRQPAKPGENLYYKAFHSNAYCDGSTPLGSGKPLRVSFDQNQPGRYAEKDYFRDWNCPQWGMGLDNLAIVDGQQSRTGKDQVLRITLPKGRSGCHAQNSCANWKPKIGAKLDSLYYAYWVKVPENFDFVRGGKLPGIGSDQANTGGKKPNGRDGWSVRVMWDNKGQLGQYVYHPDQPKPFGEFFPWDAGPLQKGQWHQIKTFVRLNTPGKQDGIVTTWLNGKKVMDKRDLRFRLGNDLQIERFLFSVFYGGSGPSWAPPRDMLLYLDEFVLSSRRF